MAPKQKAVIVTQIGQPVILTHDHPIPSPGQGHLQIKVIAAGLNPHDQKMRDWGIFIRDNLPSPLANDVVGIVSMLGPGVSEFVVGDRVLSQASVMSPSSQLGTQEYALVDARFTMKVPDDVSDGQALTLPTNLIAVVVGIFHGLNIPAPWDTAASEFEYGKTTVLIVGGGSNCGKLAVQLCRLAGIGRIVIVGGDRKELTGYGATHVVNRHGDYETTLSKIRDVVQDSLVYAFDVVNDGNGQLLALNALSSGLEGTMARLRRLSPVDESKVVDKKAGFKIVNVVGASPLHPDLTMEFWKRLPEYLVTGKIIPLDKYDVKHGLLAETVNEVLDRYRDGLPVIQTHVCI